MLYENWYTERDPCGVVNVVHVLNELVKSTW